MALPTPTELREFLLDYGISAETVTNTWITARLSGSVVPFIEQYTGRPVDASEEVEQYYSGNGMSTLILRHKKLASFGGLEYLSYNNVTTEVDSSSLVCDLDAGILKKVNGTFPKGERNLKITYTVGSATVPDDIKELCLYLLGELTLTFLASQTGGGSPASQGYNRNFGDRGRWTSIRNDFNRHALVIIKRYTSGIA